MKQTRPKTRLTTGFACLTTCLMASLPMSLNAATQEQLDKLQRNDLGTLYQQAVSTRLGQSNHLFMSIYAVFKLECLKLKYKTNHFALRTKLLVKANRNSYDKLKKL